ncbi:MAG: thioesterase [Flavobacteriaceae bacterium]|nr:thioesterase [Flavobacteriaceae bacterium]|tara:strand:+ start:784 stop:1185 length:402 start_codon:yes stop_codon:yes gene_type:complete
MRYITKMNKVRYYETDQMGFVHHSNYLKYFEMARIEWFDFLDIRYVELEKKNIWLPVVECSISYMNPLFFGDQFKVEIKCEKEPMSKIEFSYHIINNKKVEICRGITKLAFYDPKTKKPKKCPLEIKEKFFNS